MNWIEIFVGALVGAFVVNIFWGIQQMREVVKDTNYSRGLTDGLNIDDRLTEIAKLLEKEYKQEEKMEHLNNITLEYEKEVFRLQTLLKEQEVVEPTINEYGEAYCICGENVGIIPNSKNLPSVRSKYCHECGRRMKWNARQGEGN